MMVVQWWDVQQLFKSDKLTNSPGARWIFSIDVAPRSEYGPDRRIVVQVSIKYVLEFQDLGQTTKKTNNDTRHREGRNSEKIQSRETNQGKEMNDFLSPWCFLFLSIFSHTIFAAFFFLIHVVFDKWSRGNWE